MANPTQLEKYFPLRGLVLEQIKSLDGFAVRKEMTINGEAEAAEKVMSEEEWRNEMDIFIQSDINKSANADTYVTEEKEADLIHRLKPGARGEVKEIRVSYFTPARKKVKQVAFTSETDNLFYHSKTEGTLGLDEASGLISRYEVHGTQKVWFLSPNEMRVKGAVVKTLKE